MLLQSVRTSAYFVISLQHVFLRSALLIATFLLQLRRHVGFSIPEALGDLSAQS